MSAVIGILFTIVTVAWSITLRQGEDDTRHAEQQEWVSRFETYQAQQGVYPNSSSATDNTSQLSGRYCLGTNFPNNRCGNNDIPTDDASPNRVMQELRKVGTLPEYEHKLVRGRSGPWADYQTPAYIRVYQAYYNSQCPNGTTHDSTYSGEGAVCYVTLSK